MGIPALFPSRVSSAPPERARDFAPTVRSARQGPFRSRPQRSPIARLASAASASRSGPFRIGAPAKGGELRRTWHGRVRAFRERPRLPPRRPSGLGRSPHPPDAGHPALAEYRLRGLASPRRRGGASGRPRCARPRVRPRPVLRAGGTTFGLPYGASLALAPTLRRRSAALPRDGGIYPVAQPR